MSAINAEVDRVGRPRQEINEEELKESLKCEMLENCTPQYCFTCQEKFSSQLNSKAHYAGKPHQKLLQIKLKIMLRKKINKENLRKKLGDSEFINSTTIATEAKQIVTAEMAGVKTSIKEETGKRTGDHLDEMCDLPSNLLENCQPTYCDVCFIPLPNENTSRTHYEGKPHKKKLKLLEMERNPTNYTCSLCQVTAPSEVQLEIHLQGSKHKSKKAQQKALRTCSGTEEVKTEQVISIQSMKSGSAPQKENMNGLYCDVCDVTGSSEMDLKQHLNGKAHKKKFNLIQKGQNQVGFICKLCKVSCTGQKTLKSHLQGQHHLAKLKNLKRLMNENTRGKSVIKDEKRDDVGDKDVPDLCDPMSNLAGYSDRNNELKITHNVKEKEVHPAEIEKSCTNKSSEEEDIIFVTENIEVNKSVNGDDEREEEASSDDDLIILENPDSLSPQKPIQNTPNLNNAPLVASVKLCVYPLGRSESVSVSTGDFASLAYDTFLNDIIIDFYLLYLANNVLSDNDREKVHIFSTMFYSRLVQSPRAHAKKVPEYENDNTLTPSEIRHFRVASWTKSVDLFEKDMIIIPICEEFHWYLLLVVKSGMMFLPFKSKERKARGEPFMIVLDSMGGTNITTVKNIRRYLACEWNKKKCGGAKQLTKLEEMGRKTSILRPNKPEQENNCDCGIFLLEYVDTVFQNVSKFLWPSYVNSRSSEWFTSEEVAGKREEIAQLVKRLTKEQKPGEIIKYPNIKFTAEGVEDVKEN